MPIYRNKTTGIFVTLAAETDGYYGDFGLEYWQIVSPEESWNYVGASPYEMDRAKIEQSPEWEKVK